MSQITEPRETGGPAFPTTDPNYEQRYAGEGMALRDYFAAKAMQTALYYRRRQFETDNPEMDDWDSFRWLAAEEAYEVADDMLKARTA